MPAKETVVATTDTYTAITENPGKANVTKNGASGIKPTTIKETNVTRALAIGCLVY